jgi:hypothetical protein
MSVLDLTIFEGSMILGGLEHPNDAFKRSNLLELAFILVEDEVFHP